MFPGNFARSVVLRWNEEDGYQVSLARSNRPLSATRTVPVDDLAEVILAYLDRCRLPIPDATAAEVDFWGWSWERVESTLNEAEEFAPFRTTAAAMKRMLPRLKVELQAIPPYVSHVTLMFPCAFRGCVLLHWDEAHGYQISIEIPDTAPSKEKAVSEDKLSEELLAVLEHCSPDPVPPPATPSPAPKAERAKRRAAMRSVVDRLAANPSLQSTPVVYSYYSSRAAAISGSSETPGASIILFTLPDFPLAG